MEVFSSDDNPFFPQERYEQAKEEMPEPIFKAEYKGEFVESLLTDNVFIPSSIDMGQRRWKRRVQFLPEDLYGWIEDRAKVDEMPPHDEANFSKAQGSYIRQKPKEESDMYDKWKAYSAAYSEKKKDDSDASDDYEQDDPEAGILKYGLEEQANKLLKGPNHSKSKIVMGLDVADEGQDESVLTIRWGNTVLGQMSYVISTDRLVSKVKLEYNWFDDRGYDVAIWVDAPGLGKAVINDLRADGLPVDEYWPSDKTPEEPRRYLNLKSWLFFQARKRMLAGIEAVPEERKVRRQLLSQSYSSTDKDKIKMKKDSNNSLDYCDSYVISIMGVDPGVDPAENIFFI